MTSTRRRREFDALDQEQRTFRARMQAGNYTITPHDGSYILEKVGGTSYIVSADACSCDDWNYRVSKVPGARCKHQCLVGQWLIEQGLEFITPPSAPSAVSCVRPASVPGLPEHSGYTIACQDCGAVVPLETMEPHGLCLECADDYVDHPVIPENSDRVKCSRCSEPLPSSALRVIQATGEMVCQFCTSIAEDEDREGEDHCGPEEFPGVPSDILDLFAEDDYVDPFADYPDPAGPEELSPAPVDAAKEAALARIFE